MTERVNPRQFQEAQGAEDWRVLGDGACAFFRTGSFRAGARLVQAIAALSGVEEQAPAIDLRHDGVTVRLIKASEDSMGMTTRDLELARQISAVAREQDVPAEPSAVQSVLVIPGAPRRTDILPFWQALLGYERRGEEDLVDPHGRGPAFWFERMLERRGDGGAIHIAIWVPYEQADRRVAAALAAGGHLVRDSHAPAWWTLADGAGNEADVATTRDRD